MRKRKPNMFLRRLVSLTILGILIMMIPAMLLNNGTNTIEIKENYIESTKPLAISVAKKNGLFPSVTLAQSALESNFGRSELSTTYNNYFGIKAKSGGVEMETKEYENGVEKSVLEPFKKYDSKKASFKDYGRLISTAARYEKVRDAKDYKEAITLIQSCGYATDPNYAKKVIDIIEKYNLMELDNE